MTENQTRFEKLYHEYKKLVFNVALNYLQNLEDAEEVTQDVFVKVYQCSIILFGKLEVTPIYKVVLFLLVMMYINPGFMSLIKSSKLTSSLRVTVSQERLAMTL